MDLIGNVQLVTGGEEMVAPVLSLLRDAGWVTEGNPDVDVRVYPQFRVEDARLLCERAMTRSVTGTRRVFIVVTPNLTYEAQNTMLKTLEEPAGNALFFFLVPAPESLLPTILSRAQMLPLDRAASTVAVDPAAFLAATPQKRLDMLKPLLDKGEDDPSRLAGSSRGEVGVRDISSIILFLSSLERMMAERAKIFRPGIDAVYRARKYATDKGSMLKPLLEQVALLTPVLPS